MGRITTRRPVLRLTLEGEARRRADTVAVEEPLEIRVVGTPLAVTMRTPGHDVELAAGFLVSEGIIASHDAFRSAIHCGGPGTGGAENTYNVLDVALAPGVPVPGPESARAFFTTSSCGVCGKASIDAVETVSQHDVAADPVTVLAEDLAEYPDRLRAHQEGFEKTGGLHAAALFDAATGDLLVVREDVGRHNAVDKVVGWAVLNERLPLNGTVLQVSGRASFELVQKATMAGIPVLAAVSAPSSLAVDLAERAGLTLIGFLRGRSMNVYSRADRLRARGAELARALPAQPRGGAASPVADRSGSTDDEGGAARTADAAFAEARPGQERA
ncbi:formate dehydrogenase accessory sulfurtransferase FdhD [Microbacterium flavum]|uniref:formate dehydrogenase accessory sulfurtransferase FdhD n=1 Tax=Microbacterium flavum TaxID=415216 RepID=UPI0024ACB95F|nr:formate dehydrogenase accessory sulfurtransferase FdhD [Microbacterium flavum]